MVGLGRRYMLCSHLSLRKRGALISTQHSLVKSHLFSSVLYITVLRIKTGILSKWWQEVSVVEGVFGIKTEEGDNNDPVNP